MKFKEYKNDYEIEFKSSEWVNVSRTIKLHENGPTVTLTTSDGLCSYMDEAVDRCVKRIEAVVAQKFRKSKEQEGE